MKEPYCRLAMFSLLQISIIFYLLPHSSDADGTIAFIPRQVQPRPNHNVLAARKKKPSMAERRKRRAARGSPLPNMDNLPPSKLDFSGKQIKSDDSSSSGYSSSSSSSSSRSDSKTPPELKQSPEAKEIQAKADELLETQRKSVQRLTFFRERIEALPGEEIQSALNENGFFMLDDFLGDDDDIVNLLQKEGLHLLQENHMEVDVSNLGSGEYLAKIKGGAEQYPLCPRSIELTVSVTKYIPDLLKEKQLDASACSSFMRTFNRNSLVANLELLTGKDEEKSLNDALDSLEPKSFGTVITGDDDQRRLTLLHFLVPESWDSNCGGALTFQTQNSQTTVEAKRDRLVIWNSDTIVYRQEPWKGKNNVDFGSCMEVHLVKVT